MENNTAMTAQVEEIVNWLDAKKARDIVTLEVTQKTVLADWFVIASAQSLTQVRALTDYVLEQMKKTHAILPLRVEGLETNKWVLLDFGDIVVHLFQQEERTLYNLESLWQRLEQ